METAAQKIMAIISAANERNEKFIEAYRRGVLITPRELAQYRREAEVWANENCAKIDEVVALELGRKI